MSGVLKKANIKTHFSYTSNAVEEWDVCRMIHTVARGCWVATGFSR